MITAADPDGLEIDRFMLMLNMKPFDTFSFASIADAGEWSRWFAVSGIMENWDSPWHRRGNNYTLYRPPGGRWQILPWDPDHIYENKGLYFPRPRVKGLYSLFGSEVFLKQIRIETRRLIHGKLSAERVLAWIEEAKELLLPPVDAGEEAGIDRRKWERALKRLKINMLKRYSALEKTTCSPPAGCGNRGEPSLLW